MYIYVCIYINFESVCRADVWCNRHCKGPHRSGWIWGYVWPKSAEMQPDPILLQVPALNTFHDRYSDMADHDESCGARACVPLVHESMAYGRGADTETSSRV